MIAVWITALTIGGFAYLHSSTQSNCEALRGVLVRSQMAIQESPSYTPERRARAIEFYEREIDRLDC